MAKKTENKGGAGKAPAKKAAEAHQADAAQPTQAEDPSKKVETRKKGEPVLEM